MQRKTMSRLIKISGAKQLTRGPMGNFKELSGVGRQITA